MNNLHERPASLRSMLHPQAMRTRTPNFHKHRANNRLLLITTHPLCPTILMKRVLFDHHDLKDLSLLIPPQVLHQAVPTLRRVRAMALMRNKGELLLNGVTTCNHRPILLALPTPMTTSPKRQAGPSNFKRSAAREAWDLTIN